MSKYTTGEVAKLCGVTVRTIQYYDQRGVLKPSERTDGGRRLYSDEDINRLKIICFLRDLDLPIDAISEILNEEHPERVLSLLIDAKEKALQDEITKKKEKLEKLRELKSNMNTSTFSLTSITDIAMIMKGKTKLKKLHLLMIIIGLPVNILQWTAIMIGILKGLWWPCILWLIVALIWGVLMSRYYFNHVQYICPECHHVFKPTFKESFWAKHTPTTRKLTCTTCHHKGYCIEVWGEEE